MLLLNNIEIVSLDLACTLFWEPGCDPRYTFSYLRSLLYKILEIVRSEGYSIELHDDPLVIYQNIWNEIQSKGPCRELWHKYILLRFLYRVGAEIDTDTLDKIYEYFISERIKHFTPFSRAEILLSYLRSRGYKLVLTTATASHDFACQLLRRNKYDKYIELVFSTQLVGIPKTDPRFYEELVVLLNIEPDKIVHIGDSIKYDVEPAEKIGLKTIFYGWRTQCRAVDPQPCITSLYELYYLL